MIHLICDWCARKAQWYPTAPLPDGWVAIGVQHFCGSTCLALYLERAGVQATPDTMRGHCCVCGCETEFGTTMCNVCDKLPFD